MSKPKTARKTREVELTRRQYKLLRKALKVAADTDTSKEVQEARQDLTHTPVDAESEAEGVTAPKVQP